MFRFRNMKDGEDTTWEKTEGSSKQSHYIQFQGEATREWSNTHLEGPPASTCRREPGLRAWAERILFAVRTLRLRGKFLSAEVTT